MMYSLDMAVSNRTRRTLKAIFSHPLPRNLDWLDLIAAAEELGVRVVKKGKGKKGPNAAVFLFKGKAVSCHRPHQGGTDKGAIAAVRDLLKAGGVTPESLEE